MIVLDHGFCAHHRLLDLGTEATRVTHFFCSHLHYDHMGDYPRLLLTRWDQGAGRIPELKVYGPPPIKPITAARGCVRVTRRPPATVGNCLQAQSITYRTRNSVQSNGATSSLALPYMTGLLLCCLLAAFVSQASHAQNYPTRPVRLFVGYPAGGSIDTVGRITAQAFTESMGQSFIVDNRPGASATIATSGVVKAPPDGYTLLVGAQASLSGAPSLIAKLSYDPIRDLSAIALLAHQPNVLIVHPSVPVRTTREFIALAKARPGKLAYGSSGMGSTQHLSSELFSMMTGTELYHVPYKGGSPATVDLLSGQLDFTFTPVPSAGPYIRANKVRAIALTSIRRNESLPGVPTLNESGVRGYDFGGYAALLGPAKMPRELVTKLNAEVQKALTDPNVRKKFVDLGLDVPGGTPEQFTEFMKQDMDKCAKIVAVAKIQPQ